MKLGKFFGALKRAGVGFLVIAILALALPVGAQSPSGSGLSITPTLTEFTLNPGQADKLDITLKNITVNPLIAQASINDFESDNVTGNPKLLSSTAQPTPNSIRNFVVGLDNVPLAINEQKTVSVAVQIPKGTPAGAYFGVIRYRANPAIQGAAPAPGEVSLSASVGTIVLITVPGQIKEQVQLTGLHIYSGPKNTPRESTIFFSQPNRAGVEVKNLGNGFAKPYGTIEISRTFGSKVYSYQLNGEKVKANVLPNSSRTFVNPIFNIKSPGRYTLTANVSYGNGSDVLVLSKSFWYIPVWLLFILAAIVVVLIGLVFFTRRRSHKGSKNRNSHRGY